MAVERVQPVVRESTALGGDSNDETDTPHPVNPNEDGIETRRVYLQNDTSRDSAVYVDRDASDNGVLVDVTGSRTFSSLANQYDLLLETQPVFVGITYTPTYSSGKITLEEWKRTAGAALVKSIAYTYIGNKLNTEVRKVYNAAGLVVVAQITWTYIYTGNIITSATMTRDV